MSEFHEVLNFMIQKEVKRVRLTPQGEVLFIFGDKVRTIQPECAENLGGVAENDLFEAEAEARAIGQAAIDCDPTDEILRRVAVLAGQSSLVLHEKLVERLGGLNGNRQRVNGSLHSAIRIESPGYLKSARGRIQELKNRRAA